MGGWLCLGGRIRLCRCRGSVRYWGWRGIWLGRAGVGGWWSRGGFEGVVVGVWVCIASIYTEITGPDRPRLTIVDLPGLIHSATRHQSSSDGELIRDVV